MAAGKAGAGRGDGRRACVSRDTCTDPPACRMGISAPTRVFWGAGDTGMGQARQAGRLCPMARCGHQLLCRFLLRLLLVLCPEILTAGPGWGAVSTLAVQGGDPHLGHKIFSHALTWVPQGSPPSACQTQTENSRPEENRIKVLSCAFAVPLHLRQSQKAGSATCPIPKKSQICRPAGMVQHPAALQGSCQAYPCTHEFLERILHPLPAVTTPR